MADKTKKNKALFGSASAAQVPDFELIPTLTQPVIVSSISPERNEKTYDLRNVDIDLANKSAGDVEDLLREHLQRAEDLEFQLEQSRVRQRGLEKELGVREEIAADLNANVRATKRQLAQTNKELEALRHEHVALQTTLAEVGQLASDSGHPGEDRKQTANLEQQLHHAQLELSDLRNYIDGRKASWEHHRQEIKRLQTLVDSSAASIESLIADIAERDAQLSLGDEQFHQLSQQSLANEKLLVELRDENADLRSALHETAEPEIRRCHERIAEQAGEIAAQALTLETLRSDNLHFQEYSDSLRIKLQDQITAAGDAAIAQEKLQTGLDAATSVIADLNHELDRQQAINDELTKARQIQADEHDREVRQIRFELGHAEQTISEQGTVNEQLVSDLIDNRQFREALESHIGQIEKESSKMVKQLRKQLQEVRDRAERSERKLRERDETIADLMREMAVQGDGRPLADDVEHALHKVDGFLPETPKRKEDRDRLTRLLIGSADDRDLRFPLFRDRLSIGRTSHNDIQLDMRFVSRRHAVIATDGGKTRIIDWGSRNGVYVNKKRVTEKLLKPGDVITIGLTDLRYEERPKR